MSICTNRYSSAELRPEKILPKKPPGSWPGFWQGKFLTSPGRAPLVQIA